MSQNLPSKSIHVFPFGTTRQEDRLARVLNEQNLTTIVRNMTDYPSYVLRYDNTDKDEVIIDFVINGYYFSANISSIIEQGKPLYAQITIESDETGYSYLAGGDGIDEKGVSRFTGVTFTNDQPLVQHYLKLLDENGNIPPESLQRLSGSSIDSNASLLDIDIINCGSATTII